MADPSIIYTKPYHCKEGKFLCMKPCDCQPINFLVYPEKWIMMHCARVIRDKSELKSHTVQFVKLILARMKDCPVISYDKFKDNYKSPELEILLRKN
ncbi:MAG: hypothetical protein HS129_04825 [Leptospiraceae bacterium]|nr:hypothetical protein [Leptospiraceae bacterium]